ncbi:hypothetical protein D3C81_804360 [compost metagenome]
MYKSVIQGDKFLVIVYDGVFSSTMMDLPTEELADKVAFELQMAYKDGKDYGAAKKWQELDSKSYNAEISKMIKKFRSMKEEEREAYQARLQRRHERKQKVKVARTWQSVLSWKGFEYAGDDEI